MLRTARGFFFYRVAVVGGKLGKARVVLVSPSIVDVAGIEDPYDFNSWFAGFHPDDMPRIMRANQYSITTGAPYDEVARWYHGKRKEWIWVRTLSQPVFNSRHRLTHFNGLCVDVTDRKQAEQKLIEQGRQLRALVTQLTVAEEAERRRIADGLHDDISQWLVAAQMKLAELAGNPAQPVIRKLAHEASGYLDRVIHASRTLTFDLASPVLRRFGFEPAVEDLCEKISERHSLRITFKTDQRPKPLAEDIQTLVFHGVRELLRNVARHARATRARVELRVRDNLLCVTVTDNGVGVAEARRSGNGPGLGFGLVSLRERMEHLGGRCVVAQAKPRGTHVTLLIPIGKSAPALTESEPALRAACKPPRRKATA